MTLYDTLNLLQIPHVEATTTTSAYLDHIDLSYILKFHSTLFSINLCLVNLIISQLHYVLFLCYSKCVYLDAF